MATITVETIEKLNIASVLQALEQERKAQKALENVVWATNASKKESVKVIGAQIRALQKENDEIEAITAKWEAARAAERGYEIAAQGAGAASKDVSAGLRGLSFQLNDVVTGLASGQKPMQIFAQQGGQIFQAFQQTPGLLAGVASGLGTVGAGVAALAAPLGSVLIPLWLDYSQAQDQATASLEAWNEAEAATLPLLDKATKDVERLVELTEGSLTLDQTKAKIARQYNEQLEAANRPLKDRIAILEEEERTLAKTDSRYKMVILELREKKRQIEENNDAAAKGAVASALVAEFAYEEAESERVLAERKKASTDARKAAKDAAKEEAEALKELLFLMGVDEEIMKVNAGLLAVEKEEQDKVTASVYAYIAANEQAGKSREEMILRDIELTKQAADAERARYERGISSASAYTSSASDLFGTLSDYYANSADMSIKSNRDAAMKMWGIQQGLIAGEVALNTILAASTALATPPAPNFVAAGIATAAGVAQEVAIIAQPAPSFTDLPPTRMGGANGRQTPWGQSAINDTVHAYRDPVVGIAQVVEDAVKRSLPAPPVERRGRIGPQIAQTATARLLTRDVERITRGRIFP